MRQLKVKSGLTHKLSQLNSDFLKSLLSIDLDYDSDSSEDSDEKDLIPRKKIVLEILVSSNFYDSETSQNRFLASIMPMSIKKLDQ